MILVVVYKSNFTWSEFCKDSELIVQELGIKENKKGKLVFYKIRNVESFPLDGSNGCIPGKFPEIKAKYPTAILNADINYIRPGYVVTNKFLEQLTGYESPVCKDYAKEFLVS